MASQTQGIQQLLAAEKRADEKVKQARTRKALRLKKAKEDAQVEIHKFKDERETQFRNYEARYMGSKEDDTVKIERETQQKIEEMRSNVAKNKEKIIQYLISQVFNVKPQLHQNFRENKN